ncbi:MAG: tyrosine-type recombinase/integrase [Acidobacteria bacterium]|nr:tyrosine-type recombinase/integrase [Acidobacteriota bacterium]
MNTAPALAVPRPELLSPALMFGDQRQRNARSILEAWRAGKSPHTMRSYEHDLEAFARFLSAGLDIAPSLTVEAALDRLFQQDSASAHGIVLNFRGSLLAANLAPATINRALATLRSVSKLARMLGVVQGGWIIEVPGVKAERRRDTRGPAVEDVRRMLEATAADTETETRDHAIVATLFCLGLRVSELCGLNLEETDLARGTTWIRGKGRRERELVPLPETVVAALRRYLAHRGAVGQGPLFLSRSHRPGIGGTKRLHARSVLRLVTDLGERVGVRVWCHALRHTAITTAVARGAAAGLRLDQVRAYSRHKTVATLIGYVDEHDRAGVQRQITDVVAAALAAA